MAGTLVVGTISNGTYSTPSANVIKGSARAWVNFNGTSGTSIRGSYNVSSVTYTSAGRYVVNYTTPFNDENYAVACSINRTYDTSDGYGMSPIIRARTQSATSIDCRYYNSVAYDQEYVAVVVFGVQ